MRHLPPTITHLVRRSAARPAFTLLEALIVIIIIALLSGLVLVGVRRAVEVGRREAERQILVAFKQGITNFENEFRFLPPLVSDNISSYPEAPAGYPVIPGIPAGPVAPNASYANSLQPVVIGGLTDPATRRAHDAFLQGFESTSDTAAPLQADYRFSVHSLPYYLMGMLNVPGAGGKPADGADGPRFTAPRVDGSFTGRGKAYEAYYDPGDQVKRLAGANSASVRFNDRWGSAIRYYRWETRPGSAAAQLGTPESRTRTMVPRAAGDPRTDTKLRGARYALVIVGPDRVTDMGPPVMVGDDAAASITYSPNVKDDLVEVEE